MRTLEITAYSFAELSEQAKQTAYNAWLRGYSYPWASAARESLDAFCKMTGAKIGRYGFETGQIDDAILKLSGARLHAYLWNRFDEKLIERHTFATNGKQRKSRIRTKDTCCPFTGTCFDEDLLQPIRGFLKKGGNCDFEDLLGECFRSWETAVEDDNEYLSSIEAFGEDCKANEWEFDETGRRI